MFVFIEKLNGTEVICFDTFARGAPYCCYSVRFFINSNLLHVKNFNK